MRWNIIPGDFYGIRWHDMFDIPSPGIFDAIPLHDMFATFTTNVKIEDLELHP